MSDSRFSRGRAPRSAAAILGIGLLLAGSIGVFGPAVGVQAAASAGTTFTTPGSASYTVPSGTTQVEVIAVGGQGAPGPGQNGGAQGGQGGMGALVTAVLPVTSGEHLAASVAGDGINATGGLGGGGAGGALNTAGGGGGASVVSNPGGNDLVVAGGGGGGGGGSQTGWQGGNGGSAGATAGGGGSGANPGYMSTATGGAAGTPSAGGAGGSGSVGVAAPISCTDNFNGTNGAPGTSFAGGGGGSEAGEAGDGGGGGAGYYGGGGGGGGATESCSTPLEDSGGGGGGAGSSYVAASATGTTILTASASDQPSITIIPLATITSVTAPGGVVGQQYSLQLQAAGGATPYQWSYSGTLPAGLTLDTSSGLISGIPTATGTSSFQVSISNGAGATPSTISLSITVTEPLVLGPNPPAAVVNQTYTGAVTATGGTTQYTFTLSGGALPTGLSLGSTGDLTGTPTATGSYNFTVTVTDLSSPQQTATQSYTLLVQPPLAVGTSSLSAVINRPYSASLKALYGTGHYTWSITSGTLPAGLVFTANGDITGTATTLGQSTITFQVTDQSSPPQMASAAITFAVVPPPPPVPVVTSVSPSSGPPGGGSSVTIAGENLQGATLVYFGQVPAPTFTVESNTEIIATAPAGSGSVNVTVETSGGVSATGSADQYTYATAPPPPTFSDVPPGYWAYSAITELAQDGIISGYPDGNFRPDQNVTRAQFVKMLVLSLGLTKVQGSSSFSDVPATAWFAPYVDAAVKAGIVQGVPGGRFDPGFPVTREQAAVMVARGLHLTKTTTLTFSDSGQIGSWALTSVEETVAAGLMAGFPDGTFHPLAVVTRAQAAEMLAGVLGYLHP